MYGTFTSIWLIFIVNVSKHTSPMDGVGKNIFQPSPVSLHPNSLSLSPNFIQIPAWQR